MKAKITIGVPELQRWARGEAVTVRLKPGTEELTIAPSSMAQGELNRAVGPKTKGEQFVQHMMDRMP